MKNIHILPTDKPSKLAYYQESTSYSKPILQLVSTTSSDYKYQNIYITNSEEIKVNDYITNGYVVWQWKDDSSLLGRKKVILTTDQDLIKDGVQAIDDEFLEWFVKNPSCEEVNINRDWGYPKIIIPKEEPKFGDSFENLANVMSMVNFMFGVKEEPKQETLEEASWKFNPLKKLDGEFLRAAFIKGAKWQAERMYSEEEVFELIYKYEMRKPSTVGYDNVKKWFEQFKKKV